MKYQDMNGNGVKDPADTGLAGWTIHITIASPPGSMNTVTGPGGTYTFTNLSPGSYTVSEVPETGWTQKFPPTGTYTHILAPGENATGFDFGNYLQVASISGTLFEDVNGDTLIEGGEPRLAGWSVILAGTASDTIVTDSTGAYAFQNLGPGAYTVSEVVQPGWERLRPAGGAYGATLARGISATTGRRASAG
jgi:hypothetical protein